MQKFHISRAYSQLREYKEKGFHKKAAQQEKIISKLVARYKDQQEENKRFFALIVLAKRNGLEKY